MITFSMPNPFHSNALIILILRFTDHLDRRTCETKFPPHVSFVFPIFYISYHFKFSFDAQNLHFVRHGNHYHSTSLLFAEGLEVNRETLCTKWNICSPGMLRSVDRYRRFGTTYLSHLQESSSPINVGDYQSTMHNIPRERGSHLHRGASSKS